MIKYKEWKTLKRLLLGSLMMVLVFSCLIPLTMAEDAVAPTTAPVADTAAINRIVVADFEDSSSPAITTFADGASKITITYVTDIFYEGKQSIKVEANTSAWDGAVYAVPEGKGDWTGMTTFKTWIYGSNSKKGYDIEINDAGKELFLYPVKDNWEGWKQVIIPLKKFVSRSDYQDSKAKVNRKIDMPVGQVQFFNASNVSGGSGKLTLYFDLFEVTNE
jgi:hypothetical protein